ncbi:LacI family DNA-binding transcriptional regulator [Streptomyces sp. MP131-18]|uniref:LacI family DNA-binding transcriptional regulator n=1 Tax=Streptomyces sp. MP131-18 TaxID=1857892 RepID=UPI00097BFF3C|nr:LacI family DNA-binding transcriptional regulator [Streptomyces sp. MP131-18]ONK11707.1 Degradation activator [Streptomyces sp. MP131-18]
MPRETPGSARPGWRPSLKDVATLAGVSVMTVSNVVRGAPNVSAATRERVLDVIERVGYVPNSSARNLRAGRSGVVSFAIPAIDNSYFAELARLMMDEAAALGRTVLIEQTKGDRELERRALTGYGPTPTDGLVFFPQALDGAQVSQYAAGRPLVLLGDRGGQGPGDVVTVDNEGGAREAVAHLLATGRRRVAAVGDPRGPGTENSHRRLAGYRAALRQAGLPFDAGLVPAVASYTRAQGEAAAGALLDGGQPPDAVFAFNDMLAVGAVHAALSRGLRVPEDVAVAGFDGTDEARYCNPPLTTVAPDKRGIAREAMRMLGDRITRGDETPYRTVRMGHQLLVRRSTVGR